MSDPTEQEVLDLITAREKAGNPIDAEEIAEILGVEYAATDDLVADMCKRGILAPAD